MTISATDDEIAAMEALLVQISAAPWKAWSARANVKPSIIHPPGDAELGNWMIAEKVRWEIDGDFIAACRQFVPAIIARQRADAERADLAELELMAERAKVARLQIEKRVADLCAALEPFADEADTWADSVPDRYRPKCTEPRKTHAYPGSETKYTIGDLRRAAATLASVRAAAGRDQTRDI